ncbi:MAG TPA: family 20 glycosylhydrolase [Chitinophagaceae bacterium]|nr:family 20 glycosylhydrolase [Chitinophagaceae bacterium]
MKKTILLVSLVISITGFAQNDYSHKPAIIPEPVSLVQKTGVFTLKNNVVINVSGDDAAALKAAGYLSKAISTATGFNVTTRKNGIAATINLALLKSPSKELGDEGYQLSVTAKSVSISANKPAGLFYGVQTFLQLLPKEIESKKAVANVAWTAPCVEVKDYPRFGWRGLMFDVSRHFFTKEDVEAYIDQMVKYKLNLLHLHLTDDEGWRIEIKSLPRLTSVGAWNVKKVGTFGDFSEPGPDEPRSYGGFYTQDDIKELVKYAQDRFVNILPEVDIPGHSLAAVVSYPELSCTPGAENYKVRSGEKIMEWPENGHFYGLVDNTLCPANEKVYAFLDKVFTEVAQLFPFPYIHIGGDECARNFWEKSDAIKALMQKENLKNLDEVQSYFEKRVEKIVESKGKRVIGWDEILEGGLAPNAAVMSWRGIKGGIEAAKMGHEVVMSPTTFVYLDYMQSDRVMEPPVYATLRLNKTYEFEPVPDGVDAKYIKGGQANLWTEQVYNMRHAEYMTWPRGLALAECVWSPKEKKNWDDFAARVEKQFPRFDEAQVKYAPAMYDPIFHVSRNADSLPVVSLETEIKGLDIYYSFDNSFPDNFYPKYTEPLVVPKDASLMRVITYRNGKPIGRMVNMPVAELKRRAGIK